MNDWSTVGALLIFSAVATLAVGLIAYAVTLIIGWVRRRR